MIKSIATIDADGVALAAIKALQKIIEDQEMKLIHHQTEIDALKKDIIERPNSTLIDFAFIPYRYK